MIYYIKFNNLGIQDIAYTEDKYKELSVEEKSICYEAPDNFFINENICELINGEVFLMPVLEAHEILILTNIDLLKKDKLEEVNINYELSLKNNFIYDGIVYKIKAGTKDDLFGKVEICEINNDFSFCGINHNSKVGLSLLLENIRLFTNGKYAIKKSLEKQINDCIDIKILKTINLEV